MTRPPKSSRTSSIDAQFANATLDELWARGRLVERRLSYGEARFDGHSIVATDTRNDLLVEACESAIEELRRCVLPDFRMRLVVDARLDGVTSAITVSNGAYSIVTDAAHLPRDIELLRRAMLPPEVEAREWPMLWRNGSAAVLLHEAAGHPQEHGEEVELPSWLQVENPLTWRRASFRDVPLLRMTSLVARAQRAPFALPDARIEVLLVDGGHYDPLTGLVTLRIAAAGVIENNVTKRAAPFEWQRSRADIAYLGATGEPIRYPGVICSREGQELVVGSHAPLMVTA